MQKLRQRHTQDVPEPIPSLGVGTAGKTQEPHPAGPPKHGGFVQAMRMLFLALYLFIGCVPVHGFQFIGAPLYFISKNYYYTYMALTKQWFGLLCTTTTAWFSPTVVRISWDQSVNGQLKQVADGRLECTFPERLVMIANHQIYTDWLYFWWIAYTNRMHGHICIILKEALKYIPILGPGMMFYGFIFMSRNWAKDKPRMQYRLQKLKTRSSGPLSGSQSLNPLWLLIFPEGTNLSTNGRNASKKWAEKSGQEDMRHQLLPRSTGLQFCLQELEGTLDWVYDCTIAYEGIPRGSYGQDIFTLRSTYFEGRPPRSVNMYWRRFAISSIPLHDSKAFEAWLRDRWAEKDQLLEEYVQTGRFPPSKDNSTSTKPEELDLPSRQGTKSAKYIETEVKLANRLELLKIFAPVAAFPLLLSVFFKLWKLMRYGSV